MADPSIAEYIKARMKEGTGIEEIKSSLRQRGWSEEQITAAVQEIQGPQPMPSMPAGPPSGQAAPAGKKKGRGKLIIALVVFFILLFLFLYVAVNIVQDFSDMFPNAGDVIPIEIPFLS
ncbi:MAG: hypothetical protein JSV63_02470 [Candidatus Aenigmatarchaeota archaeon]|nr:MAG: hypothetical protein JSV63_02470 [Candidatus Aenigmarchaeota archaeon]